MFPSSSCLNRLRNANRNSPLMSRNLTLQADTSRQTRRHGEEDTGNRELRSEARTSASISHPERPGQGNVRQHPVVGGVSRADSPSSIGTTTGARLNAPTDGSFSVGWKPATLPVPGERIKLPDGGSFAGKTEKNAPSAIRKTVRTVLPLSAVAVASEAVDVRWLKPPFRGRSASSDPSPLAC